MNIPLVNINKNMFPEIWNFQLKWNYKKWSIEKGFEKEIMSLLRWLRNYICFKPQDVWLATKFLDVHFITDKWVCHWLELKQIPWDTFNVKKFEDDQVIVLRELEKRNSEIVRVWIYSIKHNDYKILKFSEIWNNQNEKWSVKIFGKKK